MSSKLGDPDNLKDLGSREIIRGPQAQPPGRCIWLGVRHGLAGFPRETARPWLKANERRVASWLEG